MKSCSSKSSSASALTPSCVSARTKYRVRDYVDGCGCGGTLNRLLAVYDRPEDIDWDALPERFAVKWNFGCGYNLICTDKQTLDTHAAVQQLRAWGREPFWAYYSELQYRHVDKKLLIEEYIGTPDGTLPEDYKFYCFHGQADCVMLCAGRDEGWPKFYFFDRDFQLLRINRDSQAARRLLPAETGRGLDAAFAIADRLSKPFDFVRVDLYLTPHGVRRRADIHPGGRARQQAPAGRPTCASAAGWRNVMNIAILGAGNSGTRARGRLRRARP